MSKKHYRLLIWLVLLCVACYAQDQRIRKVDFRNFTYDTEDSLKGDVTKLRDGRTAGADEDEFEVSPLVGVEYADFDGDGQEEAAVAVTTLVAASISEENYLYVFAYRNGKLQQIFKARFVKGAKMKVENKSLIIFAPDFAEGDESCCPSLVHRIVYEWRGGRFAVTSESVE